MDVKGFLAPLAWLTIGGLMVWGYQAAGAAKVEKSSSAGATIAQRKAAVKASIDAGPQTAVWETKEGKVTELYVPSKDSSGLFLQVKRCIIWQGNDSSASNMFCDADAADRGFDPGDGPDNTPPYSF